MGMGTKKVQLVAALAMIFCLMSFSLWKSSSKFASFKGIVTQSTFVNLSSTAKKLNRPSLTFHFIHSTYSSTFQLQNVRAIESVFYHHPNAKVTIHYRDKNITRLRPLLRIKNEAGYDLRFEEYNVKDLVEAAVSMPNNTINKTAAHAWMGKVETYAKAKFWYSHQTDGDKRPIQ